MTVILVSLLCHMAVRRTHSAMILGDAIDKIERFYVDPVEERDLVEAAMSGLTKTLDEHSQFIPPKHFQQFEDFLAQEFYGVGILVEQPEEDQPIRVITPLVASPALAAGILPGDRIIKVDGTDVSKMNLEDVSKRLRGPSGTEVSVEVLRDDAPQTIVITRAQIPLDSVVGDYRDENSQWVYRMRDNPRIAMIRCTSFGEKTVAEMKQVLRDLDNDMDGLILDLRGNAGGLLNAAVDICDMFIESGEIVSTRGRDRSQKASSAVATPGTLLDPDIPMVVLIDGDSASASEIVSACLQDYKRAKIIGTRSYGKGTVQNVMMMEYGRSAFKLTTARYYRPSGVEIHRRPEATPEDVWGVTPDEGFVIPLSRPQRRAIANRWRRATYPVWKDREVTSLADVDPMVDVVDPLESPLDLPVATEPTKENDLKPSGDNPQENAEQTDDEKEPVDEEVIVEETELEGEVDPDLSPDDPRLDPQLWQAVQYLQEQSPDA